MQGGLDTAPPSWQDPASRLGGRLLGLRLVMITRLPPREHVEVEVVLDRQRQVLLEVVHRRIFCDRSVNNRRRNGHGKEGAGGARHGPVSMCRRTGGGTRNNLVGAL